MKLLSLSLAMLAAGAAVIVAPAIDGNPSPQRIHVVDGDTLDAYTDADGWRRYRLIGFDSPETGSRARCGSERSLGNQAKRRLAELVESPRVLLTPIPCSCRPGTEGTRACNYSRRCARLSVDGVDVAQIMIGEGLARPYVCSATRCPPRQGWC